MRIEEVFRSIRAVLISALLVTGFGSFPANADQLRDGSPNSIQMAQLTDLASRLRETSAIGTFTKLSIKSELEEIVSDLRRASNNAALVQLEIRFHRLILKVSEQLQGGAPKLASELRNKRPQIWTALMATANENKNRRNRFSSLQK